MIAKLRNGMNVSFTDHDLMIILSLDGIDFDVVEAGKSTKSRGTNHAILGDWSLPFTRLRVKLSTKIVFDTTMMRIAHYNSTNFPCTP